MSAPRAQAREDAVIDRAIRILEQRCREPRARYRVSSPTDAAAALVQLKLARHEREVFGALFLDAQHRVIAFEEISQGTLDRCDCPPRELARAALRHNARALILAHNHPSFEAQFSEADHEQTARLREALALLEIEVLDHLLVAGDQVVSLAALGRPARGRKR